MRIHHLFIHSLFLSLPFSFSLSLSAFFAPIIIHLQTLTQLSSFIMFKHNRYSAASLSPSLPASFAHAPFSFSSPLSLPPFPLLFFFLVSPCLPRDSVFLVQSLWVVLYVWKTVNLEWSLTVIPGISFSSFFCRISCFQILFLLSWYMPLLWKSKEASKKWVHGKSVFEIFHIQNGFILFVCLNDNLPG